MQSAVLCCKVNGNQQVPGWKSQQEGQTMPKIVFLFGLVGLLGWAGILGMAFAPRLGASAVVNSLYMASTLCLVLAGLLVLVGGSLALHDEMRRPSR
jgi:hypothetical protein